MSWMNAVEDLVQRYSGGAGGAATAYENPHEDFQQVAQAAPRDVVAGGLTQAFRSDRTPPFPEMLANLFSQSNPDQRAGLLGRILSSIGGGGPVAGLPAGTSVTPEQARQISPQQVEQLAAHAERQKPSIVNEVSDFYAQHPQVVKAVGGLALSIALQHMLQRR
jgi:hypothetical protein